VLKGLAPLKSGGLKVLTLDTYDLLGEIKADPSGFGFMNCDRSVLDRHFHGSIVGTLCSPDPSDQNQFLVWDEVHPTAAAIF
jgi:phospholipase/lecithinase/hemolysin